MSDTKALILEAINSCKDKVINYRKYPNEAFKQLEDEVQVILSGDPCLLPDDRRLDMLTGALEGGSNYWYYLHDTSMMDNIVELPIPEQHKQYLHGTFVWKMWSAIKMGIEIPVFDVETNDLLGKISLESIRSGEMKMAKEFPHHLSDVRTENDDATTADVWFQYVVMGTLMFG